jgi:hypothetical protein
MRTPDHPTLRTHRVAVGVYDWDGDHLVRTQRVELDVDGERTPVTERWSGVRRAWSCCPTMTT